MSETKLAEALRHTRQLAHTCERCLLVCDAAERASRPLDVEGGVRALAALVHCTCHRPLPDPTDHYENCARAEAITAFRHWCGEQGHLSNRAGHS